MPIGFKIIKPTSLEKNSRKYKGGGWFVRRTGVSGTSPWYYATGWKGVCFTIISFLLCMGIVIYGIADNNRRPIFYMILFFSLVIVLSFIAEMKTYRRRRGGWEQFKETRRLYKQGKGIFRRP